MLGFIKKLFGSEPTTTSAPYKIELPKVEKFPLPESKKPTVKKATTRKPNAASEKKPAVKAKTARKPKSPKA